MTTAKAIKSAFEAMMFTWGEPLDARTAADVLNISEKDAIKYFEELKEEYEQEGRGIRLRRINKKFQFVTADSEAPYIERLCTPVKKRKLSQSALEVLAIVAYKQPVTRNRSSYPLWNDRHFPEIFRILDSQGTAGYRRYRESHRSSRRL